MFFSNDFNRVKSDFVALLSGICAILAIITSTSFAVIVIFFSDLVFNSLAKLIFFEAPTSSITSIAQSGKNLSVMYFLLNSTADTIALLEYLTP